LKKLLLHDDGGHGDFVCHSIGSRSLKNYARCIIPVLALSFDASVLEDSDLELALDAILIADIHVVTNVVYIIQTVQVIIESIPNTNTAVPLGKFLFSMF
jgi:hypothetical protein